MTSDSWRSRLLLPWLSIPLIATIYLVLWNRLPAQLAVHFGLNSIPDLYMARGSSLAFDLFILLTLLSGCSYKLWRGTRYPSRQGVVTFYFAISAASAIFVGVLLYNVWT